jgi:hypothetical protein
MDEEQGPMEDQDTAPAVVPINPLQFIEVDSELVLNDLGAEIANLRIQNAKLQALVNTLQAKLFEQQE